MRRARSRVGCPSQSRAPVTQGQQEKACPTNDLRDAAAPGDNDPDIRLLGIKLPRLGAVRQSDFRLAEPGNRLTAARG